jgi:hypothetical protein
MTTQSNPTDDGNDVHSAGPSASSQWFDNQRLSLRDDLAMLIARYGHDVDVGVCARQADGGIRCMLWLHSCPDGPLTCNAVITWGRPGKAMLPLTKQQRLTESGWSHEGSATWAATRSWDEPFAPEVIAEIVLLGLDIFEVALGDLRWVVDTDLYD